MFHKMKLEPFDKIKNGMKTIELRLYDEKRQQVKVGNLVEFSILDKNLDIRLMKCQSRIIWMLIILERKGLSMMLLELR